MKLEKAIQIGEQYRRDGEYHDLQDFEAFVDLGKEALKIVSELQQRFPNLCYGLLPGQTLD